MSNQRSLRDIAPVGRRKTINYTLPSTSLADFSKYVTRLLSKGSKSSAVVTKFSLKKAQSTSGIAYSQAVLSLERELTADEKRITDRLAEQVKAIANRTTETADSVDEE